MKIGITGATGQLGNIVVSKLKERVGAENLVALVRSPEKAEALGIEARVFDYNQPEDLTESLLGIDHLLLISSSEIGQRVKQHGNVINAAKKAGVQWIVYTSILRADSSTLSLAGEHLATENLIKSSGIPFTILRNGWYTENYTGSVPTAVEAGAFIGSAGEGKISSAARVDYAEAAVTVLTSKNQEDKVYELAGDEHYTLNDLVKEVSRQVGKEISYQNLPEEDYANALKGFGLPEGFAVGIASWDVSASKGDLFNDSRELSGLIGRPTTPLSDVVKEVLG